MYQDDLQSRHDSEGGLSELLFTYWGLKSVKDITCCYEVYTPAAHGCSYHLLQERHVIGMCLYYKSKQQ